MNNQKLPRLVIGLGLLIFGGYLIYNGISSLKTDKLLAPKGIIKIERALTATERASGLSGRRSLAKDAGMLFIFNSVSKGHCLWMKDMKFRLDMVWLDEQKKVVTVTENVDPNTYPKTFCPSAPAKFALEVNAGKAEVVGIKTGELLKF